MSDDIDPKKWKFGDIILNGWASQDNPTRVAYFVRLHVSQRKAAVEMTDGKGKFWDQMADNDHRLKRIGLSLLTAAHS